MDTTFNFQYYTWFSNGIANNEMICILLGPYNQHHSNTFIEIPAPSQESERSYICVLVESTSPLSSIRVLDLFRHCDIFALHFLTAVKEKCKTIFFSYYILHILLITVQTCIVLLSQDYIGCLVLLHFSTLKKNQISHTKEQLKQTCLSNTICVSDTH